MSATDTIEETPQPESQAHEGHEHSQSDHEHHQHGPALNPELTREVGVEVPAEEVARAFKTVVKRYQKQARIPASAPEKFRRR